MKAVLITGNPKFINVKPAKDYYSAIVEFIQKLGVRCVVDPGADYTCPPKADFYVAHSRGCSRYRCVENHPVLSTRFLRFGDLDGINHPTDTEWLKTQKGTPPPEHFEFVEEQQDAIRQMVASIKKNNQVAFKW